MSASTEIANYPEVIMPIPTRRYNINTRFCHSSFTCNEANAESLDSISIKEIDADFKNLSETDANEASYQEIARILYSNTVGITSKIIRPKNPFFKNFQ